MYSTMCTSFALRDAVTVKTESCRCWPSAGVGYRAIGYASRLVLCLSLSPIGMTRCSRRPTCGLKEETQELNGSNGELRADDDMAL